VARIFASSDNFNSLAGLDVLPPSQFGRRARREGARCPRFPVSKLAMKLSAKEARAIAVTAQGLAAERPRRVTSGDVRKLAGKLGVIQIDSVNVLVRSHYLPVFSRLGSYDPALLDELAYSAPRGLFEYWGHMASFLPMALQPMFRWRMEAARKSAWGGIRSIARYQPKLVRDVLAVVTERGPIGAGAIELGKARRAGWWEWSDAKRAVEYLFWSGQVTTANRRGFERLYDLPERVFPAEILALPTPGPVDACRALIELSSRAMGIASESDLRDYYRLKTPMARPAIATLVEQGILQPVDVEGWDKPAYLHREAKAAKIASERAALLSPFDNLVWARERTERLFGMKFRLEIYTPQHKRVHGYYVLPFLLGDKLVARVDLKADRAGSALLVQAAHLEPGAAAAPTAAAMSEELSRMARWLKLDRVLMNTAR